MTEKLFSRCNPNADALIVPQEEGGQEGDHYFGSIGDATLRHIMSLSPGEELLWRELTTVPTGAMFRFVPSFKTNDPDPFNLKGKDLKKVLNDLSKKFKGENLDVLKEVIEEEAARREESNDAYDRAELIPYDDWVKFPQMWDKIDIPSTPRDQPIFMGNTSQMFYDHFPEGHPDTDVINQCLGILNRDWDKPIDEGYAEFVKDWIYGRKMTRYVRNALLNLVNELHKEERDPNELAQACLTYIDNCWAVEHKNTAAKNSLENGMLRLFLKNEKEWKQAHKDGYNVYSSVKAFGQMLFKEFRDQMNGHLWDRYRREKRKYAPRVVVRNVDINRCGMYDLQQVLRIGRDAAEKVWFARPFEGLEEVYARGYITKESFGDDEQTYKVVGFIEKYAKISEETKDLSQFDKVRQVLIKGQRKNEKNLSADQWAMIWKYYRILKEALTQYLNAQKQQKEEISERLDAEEWTQGEPAYHEEGSFIFSEEEFQSQQGSEVENE